MKFFIAILFVNFFGIIALQAQGIDTLFIDYPEHGRRCLMPYMTGQLQEAGKDGGSTIRHKKKLDENEYVVIPVVVHIIHNNGEENIPDAAVHSQIEVLNEDFGRTGNGENNSAVGADTRIRFCLATQDPQGNPTTGINRVRSTLTNLNTSSEMTTKNLSRWPANRYLNIWVVRSIDGSSNTQGYAYLAQDGAGEDYDGVVIIYRYFGRNFSFNHTLYNLGRTLTHEVGHYLNLPHTWGGDQSNRGGCNDDDDIDDTPVCSARYFSGSQFPLFNCDKPEQCGNTRMIENYMDYSTDKCVNIYTKGQKAAMRNAILNYRPGMIMLSNTDRTGCGDYYRSLNPVTLEGIRLYYMWGASSIAVETKFNSKRDVEIVLYNMLGQEVKHYKLPQRWIETSELPVFDLPAGMYIAHIHAGEFSMRQKLMVLH